MVSTIDLPIDDVPDQIITTLTCQEDPHGEDNREHADYTPQTDILDRRNENDFIMETTGVVDADGSSDYSKEQSSFAVQSLQGT